MQVPSGRTVQALRLRTAAGPDTSGWFRLPPDNDALIDVISVLNIVGPS